MQSITFECEVITPMFLAGADGSTPELRPPSIKGALRFWWRALNGHLELHELKKREDEIFGGPSGRSKVSLRVREPDNPIYIEGKNLKGFKLDYLFFTFLHHKVNKKRKGFDEGTEFHVTFKSRNLKAINEFIKAFWLLTYLGALGTRSRRGLGAFKVKSVYTNSESLINWTSKFNIDKLDFDFINSLKQKNNNGSSSSTNTEFASLNRAMIYASEKGEEYSNDALGVLEDLLIDLRVSDDFTISDLDKKAAFGLPIMVRFPGSKPLELNLEKNERRASPLFISVYKDTSDEYRWTVTHFSGKFMPKKDRILLKKGSFIKKDWTVVNNELLNEFLTELKEEEAVFKKLN